MDLLDAGDGSERLDLRFALVANDPNDGPLFATTDVRSKTKFVDPLKDVVDLVLGGIGPDDEDHGAGEIRNRAVRNHFTEGERGQTGLESQGRSRVARFPAWTFVMPTVFTCTR